MFEYKDFVSEVRLLIDKGNDLLGSKQRDQGPDFRKWRNELEELLIRVKEQNYNIRCMSPHRNYGGGHAGFGSHTDTARNDRFNQELHDTLNELTLIVEHFDKYGAPNKKSLKISGLDPGYIPTVKDMFMALKMHHGYKTVIVILGIIFAVLSFTFYAGMLFEKHLMVNESGKVKEETANQGS